MALPTLDELLTIPTQDEILDQEILPELSARAVRVTDWLTGGVYRAMAYAVAKLRYEDRRAIAAYVASHFGDYVFGFVDTPFGIDVTTWAADVARNAYGIEIIEATYTKRTFVLSNATATPYGPVAAGDIIVQVASGNRYVNDEAVTIAASTDTECVFRSEYKNDSTADPALIYNSDPSDDTDIVLVTANYPGVSVTNPAGTFADTTLVGYGLGTVTLSGTPGALYTTPNAATYAVRITVSGQAAACTWEYRIMRSDGDDSGWIAVVATAAVANADGSGVTITLANHASANPSFLAGDTYHSSSPGTDITQPGRDVETPSELGTRCRAIFPALAFTQDSNGNWVWGSPTESAYELLAKAASTQVKVAIARTSTTINGKIHVLVAGQGTILGAGTIATIQAFLDSRTMLTDNVLVESPTARVVTLGAMTVTVRSSQMTAAQTEIQARLARYFGGVDPDEVLSVNGRIDRAYLIYLIRTAPGVEKVTDNTFTIDTDASAAVTTDVQLPVSATYELAVWSQSVSSAFTWATTS